MKTEMPYDEYGALKRLANGSIDAFNEIYFRYSPIVYREAYRLLRSSELAKDLVQEVFTTVWDKRTNFTRVEYFRAYLVTMSKNLAYQYLLKLSKEVLAKDEFSRTLTVEMSNTEQEADAKELEMLIEQTVDLLPFRQRQVYKMAKNRGLNYEAIAEDLNISPNTVKNHLIAAKLFIRKRLQHMAFFISLILLILLRNS